MSPPAAPGAPPLSRGGRGADSPRPALRHAPAAIVCLLAGFALCVPRIARAQDTTLSRGDPADATASVAVPAVLRVEPRGPVPVRFAGGEPGRWTRGHRTVSPDCAANVGHVLTIRRADTTARGGGRLQWSADGDDWKPLSATPAVVRDGLEPGRHRDCAVVRFRTWPPPGEPGAAPVRRIEVRFELRPRPAGP